MYILASILAIGPQHLSNLRLLCTPSMSLVLKHKRRGIFLVWVRLLTVIENWRLYYTAKGEIVGCFV